AYREPIPNEQYNSTCCNSTCNTDPNPATSRNSQRNGKKFFLHLDRRNMGFSYFVRNCAILGSGCNYHHIPFEFRYLAKKEIKTVKDDKYGNLEIIRLFLTVEA